MTEELMRQTMYALVRVATKDLSDGELAQLNIVAQFDQDPRGRVADVALALFDTERDGRPAMHTETKRALTMVALERLA